MSEGIRPVTPEPVLMHLRAETEEDWRAARARWEADRSIAEWWLERNPEEISYKLSLSLLSVLRFPMMRVGWKVLWRMTERKGGGRVSVLSRVPCRMVWQGAMEDGAP